MDLEKVRKSIIILDYEVTNRGLDQLVRRVVERIPDKYWDDFPSFSIYEGSSEEGAYVTEDYVIFDPQQLLNKSGDSENALIGLIAHELAHVYLRHGVLAVSNLCSQEHEDEADRLASVWGFEKEIRGLREKCGPATFVE